MASEKNHRIEKNHIVVLAPEEIDVSASQINNISTGFLLKISYPSICILTPIPEHMTKFGASLLNTVFDPMAEEEVKIVMTSKVPFVIQEGEPLVRIYRVRVETNL